MGRRSDIGALLRLVTDLLAADRKLAELRTDIVALGRREYATAAELADETDDIVSRTTS